MIFIKNENPKPRNAGIREINTGISVFPENHL